MVAGLTFEDNAATRARLVKLMSFADEYRNDPAVREQADADPRASLAGCDINISSEVDVRIVANTAETFYLVMPPDPNLDLSDEELTAVAGGKSAATGSFACLWSSVSSISI